MNSKPELLSPAGDLEKLTAAVLYGADAVYIGGKNFGLRANSKNFTEEEMTEAVSFAHGKGKRIYVTANIFAHDRDFDGMADYFRFVESIGVDALIISDPGVFSVAREVVPNMEVHISTQANNTNSRSAVFWQKLGASRIVLARELSFDEISAIHNETKGILELEAFVHGAMCVSYSGRCLLSAAMTGGKRNANLGECTQPCRYSYALVEETRPNEYFPVEEDARGAYILNSRDLCMIEHIPELINTGISSFKIEGRVKTPYYVATVTKAYREAIDDYFISPAIYDSKKGYYMEQIKKASYREYSDGFFFKKPLENGQNYKDSGYIRGYDFIGVVLSYDEITGIATIEQRNKFSVGDDIEILTPDGSGFAYKITEMRDSEGSEISTAPHAKQIIKMRTPEPVKPADMLRRRVL